MKVKQLQQNKKNWQKWGCDLCMQFLLTCCKSTPERKSWPESPIPARQEGTSKVSDSVRNLPSETQPQNQTGAVCLEIVWACVWEDIFVQVWNLLMRLGAGAVVRVSEGVECKQEMKIQHHHHCSSSFYGSKAIYCRAPTTIHTYCANFLKEKFCSTVHAFEISCVQNVHKEARKKNSTVVSVVCTV